MGGAGNRTHVMLPRVAISTLDSGPADRRQRLCPVSPTLANFDVILAWVTTRRTED
jgi:hypothetical protein